MSDVWYMLSNNDTYLYHYTNSITAIKFILPDQTLRLSSFDHVNDPREAKQFSLSGAQWGDDMSPSVLADIAFRLKKSWKIACFVADPKEAVFSGPDLLSADQAQAMHERGHSRARMWAQYADNHSGVCLVFDKQALAAAFEGLARKTSLRIFNGLVRYENAAVTPKLLVSPLTISMDEVRVHGVDQAAMRHGLRFWKELFLTKNKDWDGEREFRWLVCGNHSGPLFVPINGCLKGVLRGPQFPEKFKLSIGRQAKNLGVELADMTWNNGVPQIRPTWPTPNYVRPWHRFFQPLLPRIS